MPEIRLQKYFTDCGIMSRRAAEREISAGNVLVNGKIAVIGQKIDVDIDIVEYNGKRVFPETRGAERRHTYILLNKPVGYVCTMSDEKDRLTVCDLVKGIGKRVYPVGRLDMYSDGIIIMTDDGEITNKLTHPSHNIIKVYIAEISARVSEEDISLLEEPIEIDGYKIRRPIVKLLSIVEGVSPKSIVEFTLAEGRNRQVRKMCDYRGFKITRLTRTRIGEIEVGNLPIGKWRHLTENEIQYLLNI